ILLVEFAREKERSEVESRYHLEAFMDVLQGNYQHPEEMLARARLLGYDLATAKVVAIFEFLPASPEHPPGSSPAQWSKRIRDELLRAWPGAWILSEPRRVTALLPLPGTENSSSTESENSILTRLERVHTRLQQSQGSNPVYSGGLGRMVKNLQDISRSFREAQQA